MPNFVGSVHNFGRVMMALFSDKMLISHRCIRDLMHNLIKKIWTVSTLDQNLLENWVSKQSFFFYWQRPKKIFFRNKTFLFFKIESWNFQNLFEKEFRETSQNFNSIRQPIEKMKITIFWISWMSWNFVRFHEIQFQTAAESFSFLSWKTKKFCT